MPLTSQPRVVQSAVQHQRILIVGMGYVGTELAQLLVASGAEVFGLRRSDRMLPRGVYPVRADVVSGEGFEHVPPHVDQVIYAVSPGSRTETAYQAVYVDGLSRILDRLPDARLLLVSSTAVYGANSQGTITEETELRPGDGPSEKLVAGELVATRAGEHVIYRASGIYGPGRTRLLAQLAHQELAPHERTIITNRIHRDDLACCLAFSLERRQHRGIFNATDLEPTSLGTMSDWVRQQTLPPWWTRSADEAPVRARKSRAVSSQKLQALGYRFVYPSFREGYAAILAAMKEARGTS